MNIRSIAINGDEFHSYLENLNVCFDVLCLSETWSNESNLSFNHFFPNYRSFYSNRPLNKLGGGVAILVKEALNVELIENLTCNDDEFESVFVKIISDQTDTKIGCIYRPPNNNHESFLNKFNQTISRLQLNSFNCVVCGDFNYCLMKASDGSIPDSDFYETASSSSLLPVIKKPTRIAMRNIGGVNSESISLIDNILTNCLHNVHTGLFAVEISDHMPIFALFKIRFNVAHEVKKSHIDYVKSRI